jgi:transcription elongation factor GreA
MPKNYISQEGYDKLVEELNDLKTTKRREIAERIEEAKKFGDLSENAEYQEARDAQERNERRVAEVEDIVKTAEIISKHKKTNIIEVGSTIKVKSEAGTVTLTIVGSEEADPQNWRVSNESPLGKAFLDKQAGQSVEVVTPKGKTKYTIVSVE